LRGSLGRRADPQQGPATCTNGFLLAAFRRDACVAVRPIDHEKLHHNHDGMSRRLIDVDDFVLRHLLD
jgi:hypothetical protein